MTKYPPPLQNQNDNGHLEAKMEKLEFDLRGSGSVVRALRRILRGPGFDRQLLHFGAHLIDLIPDGLALLKCP